MSMYNSQIEYSIDYISRNATYLTTLSQNKKTKPKMKKNRAGCNMKYICTWLSITHFKKKKNPIDYYIVYSINFGFYNKYKFFVKISSFDCWYILR